LDVETPEGSRIYTVAREQACGDKTGATELLARQGYDGVRYAGGRRAPMRDATGAAIEHEAVMIFGASLPKVRNAITGRAGGEAAVPFAARLGGTGFGGAAGYTSTPEGASTEERIARTVAGASADGVVGYGVTNKGVQSAAKAFIADESGALHLGGKATAPDPSLDSCTACSRVQRTAARRRR
jgi:hypothetical protein